MVIAVVDCLLLLFIILKIMNILSYRKGSRIQRILENRVMMRMGAEEKILLRRLR